METPAKYYVGASKDRNETHQKEVRPAATQQDFTLNEIAGMTEEELSGSDKETMPEAELFASDDEAEAHEYARRTCVRTYVRKNIGPMELK